MRTKKRKKSRKVMPSGITHLSFLFALTFLLLAPLCACGQGAGTVNTVTLPSYVAPGYVIVSDGLDTDSMTNRHQVELRANVTVTVADSYSVEFSLIDPDNNVMVTTTTTMGAITTVPDTRDVTGLLEPSVAMPLQPGVLYRVRARLKDSTDAQVAGRTGSPGRTYVHFTGTDSSSADRNAVAKVTGVTFGREWFLETDATKQAVPVTVDYTVYRYDRWETAANTVSLDMSLAGTLTNDVDATESPITLSDNDFSVGIDSHDGAATPNPVSVSGSVVIMMDPDTILKPQMHHLDVQISHVDNPSLGTTKTGGEFASASTFLPHFTGKLSFGGVIDTHFTHLATDPTSVPTIPVRGVVYATMRIDPDANSGTVDGITNYHYGDGTVINVILDEFGDASYTGDRTFGPSTYVSGTVLLHPDNLLAELGAHNGVIIRRLGDITLDTTGGHGDIVARLPTGVGWSSTRTEGLLTDYVNFGKTDFTQTLGPLPAVISNAYAPNSFFLCEETKPIYIESTAIQWDTAQGEFHAANNCQAHSIRKPLLDFIANYSYADPSVAVKRSNDHVYNVVTTAHTPSFKKGTSGGAEMTAILDLVASSFIAHVPYDTTVTYATVSQVTVEDDLISTTTATTSCLTNAGTVTVTYNQHCQEAFEQGCGNKLTSGITFSSTSGQLQFTADGGLHGAGSVSMSPLSWGAIPKTSMSAPQHFAHRVMDLFTTGNFLMAGTFLRGDLNAGADEDGPAILLLSGFDPSDLATAERPATLEYAGGLADYAGVNFRCTAGALTA